MSFIVGCMILLICAKEMLLLTFEAFNQRVAFITDNCDQYKRVYWSQLINHIVNT